MTASSEMAEFSTEFYTNVENLPGPRPAGEARTGVAMGSGGRYHRPAEVRIQRREAGFVDRFRTADYHWWFCRLAAKGHGQPGDP